MERRRVLVVDDHEDAAMALAAVLERDGHEVFVEFSGHAALNTARAKRPDVVLLDIGLRGLSGLEVCRQIRTVGWGKDILIMAVTGWGREEDRAKAREAGFNHYLLKPVALETLNALLQDADRRAQQARSA